MPVPSQPSNCLSLTGMPWWSKNDSLLTLAGRPPPLLSQWSVTPPTLIPPRCSVMLLSRSPSTLLVNISLLPMIYITLDPLPIQFKYFPFLRQSSSKTQVRPSPRTSPSLPLPLVWFASRVYFIEFMLITASYTSLDLLQRLSRYWEAYASVINHYYLIDYKLQSVLWATTYS